MRKTKKNTNKSLSVRLSIALLVLPTQLLMLGGVEAGPWVDSHVTIDSINITFN